MAASTADAFGGAPWLARLRSSLRRLGGVAAVALALALTVALFGFDWRDPSLNQATAHVVHNPAGLAGAYAADLLYQLFGFAAWLPVLVSLSWGVRLTFGRPLAWAWVPVLSLPLALLSLSAFLATLPLLPTATWPLRVGLGGAVGDLQWRWLEPLIGARAFAGGSFVLALLLGFTALGLRWAEGIWAAGRVMAGSLWVGRHLGDAAGAATLRSGRLVRQGWLELATRLRRPSERPTPGADPAEEAPRPGRRKLVLQELDSEDEPPVLRARRPRPAAVEPAPTPAPAPPRISAAIAEPAPVIEPRRKPIAPFEPPMECARVRLPAARISTCWRRSRS